MDTCLIIGESETERRRFFDYNMYFDHLSDLFGRGDDVVVIHLFHVEVTKTIFYVF